MRTDLNADVGESFGAYTLGHDAALMPHITSASIACGFHAGDPGVMRATLDLARRHGVAVGAHPGLADLAGFGRREFDVTPREVEDLVAYQVGALAAMAAVQGLRLQHVKPHGALYAMAGRDPLLAEAVARAVTAVDGSLVLFGRSGSALVAAGRRAGLQTASEAFADRAYAPDGDLVSRGTPGAVIDDPPQVVERVLRLVLDRSAVAVNGAVIHLDSDTICLHGDTHAAVDLAGRIRLVLADAGVEVAAVGRR